MKTRLTALALLAAIVAVPSVASAATMSDTDTYTRLPLSVSDAPVVVPRDRSATASLFKAERAYLANACPSVRADPNGYSGTLSRFCSEPRG